MVSKCANPECSEEFRYLHLGKLFQLTPTPDLPASNGEFYPALYERFWLCERCCKEMTLVWGGARVKLVPLAAKTAPSAAIGSNEVVAKERPTRRVARAGSTGAERARLRRCL